MNIMDMLQQSGGIGTMAKELGVNESVAQAGAAALLPAILGGFKKTTQAQPSGRWWRTARQRARHAAYAGGQGQ